MLSRFEAIWNGCKILIVFVACTAFFYYGILFLMAEYQGDQRYDTPEGNAIKVFENMSEEDITFRERLWHFWQRGE
ncbi:MULTISPECIES: DUF4227 family protein [Geomicrobium]|uniref:DUF4227 family protein n=1 Tax=Geomicrobium sediminis TaxID=1347788 RepID=A0ABS2PDV9_9BACL|nr:MULTISPECIES: DUF4227 family protein [Geomicrobium]MBM7633600.1 hypothetical protein [Geomicrobium sediminis]GAJ98675.1 hypothetical protein JCM19055_1623 [Geomicrobium sp. JCM 19055]GAK06583.1 hypothetical protein JCM19038_286 [Geomicrobium sp. JCM 19038]